MFGITSNYPKTFILFRKELEYMKYVLTLVCFVLFLSCTKPNRQINEITKVELARIGAWSDRGAAISVDDSLIYKYFGDYNVDRGYFTGKVSKQFWDTLNRKLEQIRFKTIPVTDNVHTADLNYFELIIHWSNKKRRIIRVWNWKRDSVLNTLIWLNYSYKRLKLRQINDSIKFETTFQNPPPRPQIDQIKFPPPLKQ